MESQTRQQTVIITNPEGLHMRLAMAFATLAASYQSEVSVALGPKQANGKSLLDLITLAAMPGSELKVMATGKDADEALAALVDLVGKWSEKVSGAKQP